MLQWELSVPKTEEVPALTLEACWKLAIILHSETQAPFLKNNYWQLCPTSEDVPKFTENPQTRYSASTHYFGHFPSRIILQNFAPRLYLPWSATLRTILRTLRIWSTKFNIWDWFYTIWPPRLPVFRQTRLLLSSKKNKKVIPPWMRELVWTRVKLLSCFGLCLLHHIALSKIHSTENVMVHPWVHPAALWLWTSLYSGLKNSPFSLPLLSLPSGADM